MCETTLDKMSQEQIAKQVALLLTQQEDSVHFRDNDLERDSIGLRDHLE